jgi:hypothetical protein
MFKNYKLLMVIISFDFFVKIYNNKFNKIYKKYNIIMITGYQISLFIIGYQYLWVFLNALIFFSTTQQLVKKKYINNLLTCIFFSMNNWLYVNMWGPRFFMYIFWICKYLNSLNIIIWRINYFINYYYKLLIIKYN